MVKIGIQALSRVNIVIGSKELESIHQISISSISLLYCRYS
jgi:hypothetical protein